MARTQRHRVRFGPQRHVIEFGGPGDAIAEDTEFFRLINASGDRRTINASGDFRVQR